MTPGPVKESDELYLLSAADRNVKVRNDLLDIKLLREVDANGLERWEPVMKRGFPLPAAELPRVFDALDVAPPPLGRDAHTLGQFLTELVEPSGAARAVRVHKRRVRYNLGGCPAEIADVEVDGREARTIAIESEDASAVLAAVRGLGLDSHDNTSYPRGLAALVDAGPVRYAVIDVGTNSVKFHIGERDTDGSWRAVVDRAELTRLGEGLGDQGVISAEPLERTVAARARRRAGSPTSPCGPALAGWRARWPSSTPVAAVPSSPSAAVPTSRSASAWMSARSPTPSASASPARWHLGYWTAPWRRSPPTSPASMAATHQTPW